MPEQRHRRLEQWDYYSSSRVLLIAFVVGLATFMGYTDHISGDTVAGLYTAVIAYCFGYINGKKVTGQSNV